MKQISLLVEKTAQGKRAKIMICFANVAATWLVTQPASRGHVPANVVEFEVPWKGISPLDEKYKNPDDDAEQDMAGDGD